MTNIITNPEKNLGRIARPDFALFGFARCDFQHHLLLLLLLLSIYLSSGVEGPRPATGLPLDRNASQWETFGQVWWTFLQHFECTPLSLDCRGKSQTVRDFYTDNSQCLSDILMCFQIVDRKFASTCICFRFWFELSLDSRRNLKTISQIVRLWTEPCLDCVRFS